jgi:hypothetical protein
VRCPNKDPAGCRSTDFEFAVKVHIEMVQSAPEVTSVRESAKAAAVSWPTWRCSKWPRSYILLVLGAIDDEEDYLSIVCGIESNAAIKESPFQILIIVWWYVESQRSGTQ